MRANRKIPVAEDRLHDRAILIAPASRSAPHDASASRFPHNRCRLVRTHRPSPSANFNGDGLPDLVTANQRR